MAVFQIKNRWYYRFKIKGKEYYKAVPEATDKRGAEKAEARVKSDLLQGKYTLAEDIGEMLFKDLVKKFIDYSKSNKLSHKTDESRLKHISEFFNNKKLREISSFEIERYKSFRLKQKTYRKELISPTTVNREIEVISKMFNIAVSNRWASENPCSNGKVKKLRQDNKIERFLTPEEEKKLLSKCMGVYAYLKPIIIMALHTGMRRSEVLNLKWENVDLKRCVITLTKTKNGKVRKIPISNTLMQELKQLDKKRLSDFVFTNPVTKQNYKSFNRIFPTICEAAGIENFRFHDFRHSAATRMVSAGIDLVVVQEILGHEELKTTMRYSHPVPERKLQAIQVLDAFSKVKDKKIISIAK